MQIRNSISEILKSLSIPVTSGDLRLRLKKKSIKAADYEIIGELRKLRKEGFVCFKHNKWASSLSSSFENTPNEKHRFQRNKSRLQLPKSITDDVGFDRQSSLLNSSRVSIDKNSAQLVDPQLKAAFEGPWGMFRKLLGYYIDCIRNDEGCEASGFLEDVGKRFVFINQIGNWYPRSDYKWQCTIPSSSESSVFFKSLIKGGSDSVLVLGYPFQVFSKIDSDSLATVFVKPIFTYQLLYELLPNGLKIICDNPTAEINLDWLTYALKTGEQQKMFLSACGLMERGKTDESFGDGSHSVHSPSFKNLADGVTTYLGDIVVEPLLPDRLSIEQLPKAPTSGIYNRAVLMIGNRTRYTKSLIKELKAIALESDDQLDQTALRHVFKSNSDTSEPEASDKDSKIKKDVLETFQLNEHQRKAVALLLSKDISVVTGPPGTGKSQVVATTMANFRYKGKPAIFTSRNHKALDTVVERLNLHDRGSLIVRANSREDPFLKFGFEHAINQLLSDEFIEQSIEEWETIKSIVDSLLYKRCELLETAERVQILSDKVGRLEQKIEIITEDLDHEIIRELDEAHNKFPKAKLVSLNQNLSFYRRQHFSDNILSKAKIFLHLAILKPKIISINKKLTKYFPKSKFRLSGNSTKKLEYLLAYLPFCLAKAEYCDIRIAAFPLEEEIRGLPQTADLVSAIDKLTNRLTDKIPTALHANINRWTGLPREVNREELASLKSALKGILGLGYGEETDKEIKRAVKKNLPLLLDHFPLWAVTNLSVGTRFPLIPGFFEYAIIDEASQCDIPSAIPILFRAKRAGVVGDPHQLTHVTRISKDRESLLRKRHSLLNLKEQRFTYSDNSLYNLFAQTNHVNTVLLKDTYRSVDSIAEYSNQLFYGGALRVATDPKKLKFPKNATPGIHWTDVSSNVERSGPSGCISNDEISAVVNNVKEILLENQFEGTLGVTTPFRQQANRLNDILQQEIPAPYKQSSQLIVDTAHGFQGDERDVIIFSLCAGPDMPKGSKNFIRANPNLINVAVSRARAVLHIVGNKSWVSSCRIPHLERLVNLKQKEALPTQKTPWFPFESPWEKKLFLALKSKGVIPEIQYPIRGRRLDLALIKKGDNPLKIDIEVDGDRYHRNPDGSRKRDDVWRDIQLQGMGWRVMRFWVYQLRENIDSCVDKIIKVWNNNGK